MKCIRLCSLVRYLRAWPTSGVFLKQENKCEVVAWINNVLQGEMPCSANILSRWGHRASARSQADYSATIKTLQLGKDNGFNTMKQLQFSKCGIVKAGASGWILNSQLWRESSKCFSVLYCNTFVTNFCEKLDQAFLNSASSIDLSGLQKKRWPQKFSSCSLLLQSSHSHIRHYSLKALLKFILHTYVIKKDNFKWPMCLPGWHKEAGAKNKLTHVTLCFHCHKLSGSVALPPGQTFKPRISWGM